MNPLQLRHYAKLRRAVFPRGFLITTARSIPKRVQHLISEWRASRIGTYTVYFHPDTQYHLTVVERGSMLLIGHAYNPWNGTHEVERIGGELANRIKNSEESFLDYIDELSGRYVVLWLSDNESLAVQDCTGMQSLYYRRDPGGIYLSSHSRLIAEMCELEESPSIRRLVSSPYYKVGIRHLPGIKSPFDGVSLLTANTMLRISSHGIQVERIFPRKPIHPVDLVDGVRTISQTLAKSISLLLKKSSVAISLTAGLDSRTSLAAAREAGTRVRYFSYASTPNERADADFAQQISDELGLVYQRYDIPQASSDALIQDFCQIVHYNTVGIRNPADYLKSAYFALHWPEGEIEVKSVGTGMLRKGYCKKLGVRALPNTFTPRMMSNLYKRIPMYDSLLRFVDDCFEEFMHVTNFRDGVLNLPHDDMFFWEHRCSAWQSLVVQDSDYSRDTTSLFNNRLLQMIILGLDHERRRTDDAQRLIIELLWPELLELKLVTNTGSRSAKARLRALAERTFFAVNVF